MRFTYFIKSLFTKPNTQRYKFSIVTLAKNSEKYIEKTIQRVLMQKGLNLIYDLEYIFIYAESSDNTLEIINRYRQLHPNIIKIVNETESKGIAHAMNLGIINSTGDIIAHIHSDDYYNDMNTFSLIAKKFNQKPETKWIFSSFILVDENNKIIKKITRDYDYETLKEWCIVPHPTTFIKKEVFNEMGLFDESYKCAMDYDFWLKIAPTNTPFVFTKKFFACFRVHQDSATEKYAELSKLETDQIRSKYKNSLTY